MENQETEWKRQWRDDFLKGICGLANAQGGVLEIGRNDGVIVGVDNARELLEELPNTIRHALGLVPAVNLLDEDGKQYIFVEVAPPSAITASSICVPAAPHKSLVVASLRAS